MSLNSPILSPRSAAVAARFGARAEVYEAHAGLQAQVAQRLASFLPDVQAPRVLELGCGTGLLSRHLAARYPGGHLTLTDAAPSMIGACRRNLAGKHAQITFEVLDAAAPISYEGLDLIVTSMMLHWLPDPLIVLARLRGALGPNGVLLFATPGHHSFAEWRTVLASDGLPAGTPHLPEMPCVIEEEYLCPDEDALSFLRRMRAVGGLEPREGYEPLTAGQLRRAVRATNLRFGGRVTWHIVYGRLQRA
ncbi:MAG: methyltransferase domain-containing protein [Pseudomonadota bacterium]